MFYLRTEEQIRVKTSVRGLLRNKDGFLHLCVSCTNTFRINSELRKRQKNSTVQLK